jgi:transcriptional regulator with XRE-family HTH domain
MDRKNFVDPHIGRRLKEYREHRGMTVRDLAAAAHLSPGQISHYEHGFHRISHERVTEFARILRIKSDDLYKPPGSPLRRNHVRWRITSYVAAMIAEAVALMSSRRKAAADNEATMVAAVAVAVAAVASAAAASDAGAGEKSSLTTSADDTAVDISGSLSGAALKFNPIWHRMAETVTDKERIIVVEGKLEISDAVSETIFRADAKTTLQIDAADAVNAPIMDADTDPIHVHDHHTIELAAHSHGDKLDRPVSATSEEKSAENEFIASKPPSDNGNDSPFQFKPNFDDYASDDPKIGDFAKAKDQPAQSDNFKFKFADDDEGHAIGKDNSSVAKTKDDDEGTGKDKSSVAKIKDDATGKDKSADASADPESSNSAPSLLPVTDAQSDNFQFADEGNPGKASHDHHAKEIGAKDHPAHPHSDNLKFKFADDAHPGNDKLDRIETDQTVSADIQHLLHTAHDANAVSALDPTFAPQETTKAHDHADLA